MTPPYPRPRRLGTVALVLAAGLGLAGCVPQTQTAALGEPLVSGESWSESTTGSAPASGACELDRHDDGLLPDRACTPGAVTTAISPAETSAVCTEADEGEPSETVRAAVLSAYGIDSSEEGDYSIDFLIPRRLGGANDFANLWPVPRSDPSAAAKTETDAAVADAVCGGRAGIQAAHYALSSDWTTALRSLGLGG